MFLSRYRESEHFGNCNSYIIPIFCLYTFKKFFVQDVLCVLKDLLTKFNYKFLGAQLFLNSSHCMAHFFLPLVRPAPALNLKKIMSPSSTM